MTAASSVAIVILNWNGRHHLERFLPSVLATTYPKADIIVADNASTDDSVAFLQRTYPQITILQIPQNFGFARGYNEALKQVKADYYMLLNSDVEVTPSWLEPMVELLDRDERNAACQPKILAFNNRELFEYAGAAGGWIDRYGYPFARGRIFDICEKDMGQYNDVQPIFWASGAAMLIRSTVYHQMNGLDEYFFAHQEEIDLSWRIQLAGYKIYCCPQSVVYHVGGGTLPQGNTRKTFLNFRNNQIMLAKNLSPRQRWWKIPYRLLLDQVSALKGLLSGHPGYFWAIVKAHTAFFYWLFFAKKGRVKDRRPLESLTGVYNGNIVWQYFVKKSQRFSDLISTTLKK